MCPLKRKKLYYLIKSCYRDLDVFCETIWVYSVHQVGCIFITKLDVYLF